MKSHKSTNSLLEALDIEGLPEEDQEELLLEVSDLVFKGSLVRLMEMMDDKTKDDFEKLLDADPEQEEVEAFLEERVPDSEKAVEETIQELRDDILAVTSAS